MKLVRDENDTGWKYYGVKMTGKNDTSKCEMRKNRLKKCKPMSFLPRVIFTLYYFYSLSYQPVPVRVLQSGKNDSGWKWKLKITGEKTGVNPCHFHPYQFYLAFLSLPFISVPFLSCHLYPVTDWKWHRHEIEKKNFVLFSSVLWTWCLK